MIRIAMIRMRTCSVPGTALDPLHPSPHLTLMAAADIGAVILTPLYR